MKSRLSSWPGSIEKAVTLISRILNNVGIVFLILLMLLVTADVIIRNTLGGGITGANELAEFMMLFVVFLALAHTQLQKGNIAVDSLVLKLPKRVQAIINCVMYVLILCVSILIVWQSWIYQRNLQETRRVSDILLIPVAPFQLILIIGVSLLCVVLLFDLIHFFRKAVKP